MGVRGQYKIDWEETAWEHGFKGDDKAMITQWHHEERLSQTLMGKRIGVCAKTIGDRMKKLGVESRPPVNRMTRFGPRLPKG